MFAILFLIIFLSGAAVLVGLILGIVGLSTDKKAMRNGGFISFGLGLILLVGTIIYSINRAVNKVQEAMEPFGNLADSLNNMNYNYESNVTEDTRDYLLSDSSTNSTIRFIREGSAKKNPNITNSFYTYFGSSSLSRFPVMYPFAIHCWDSKNYGTLVNEENVSDIRYSPEGEENVVFNIQRFTYDQKLILMQTTSMQEENADINYMLYDMDAKTSKEFKSEKDLFKAAKKAGFTGENTLISIWDYDTKF